MRKQHSTFPALCRQTLTSSGLLLGPSCCQVRFSTYLNPRAAIQRTACAVCALAAHRKSRPQLISCAPSSRPDIWSSTVSLPLLPLLLLLPPPLLSVSAATAAAAGAAPAASMSRPWKPLPH